MGWKARFCSRRQWAWPHQQSSPAEGVAPSSWAGLAGECQRWVSPVRMSLDRNLRGCCRVGDLGPLGSWSLSSLGIPDGFPVKGRPRKGPTSPPPPVCTMGAGLGPLPFPGSQSAWTRAGRSAQTKALPEHGEDTGPWGPGPILACPPCPGRPCTRPRYLPALRSLATFPRSEPGLRPSSAVGGTHCASC